MHRLNLCKEYPRLIKIVAFFLFILLCIAMPASYALAHKVILSAYVEGDSVFVESGFSDGSLCKRAVIEVFDPSGKKLLEGKTNEQGEFFFRPPQKTDLKLVLDAGMGHRDEYTVLADELQDVVIGNQAPGTEAMPAPPAETRKPQGVLKAIDGINAKELESILDRVIQKRLRPLTRLVAKSQRKTGVSATEIFGGIGYILGLMGIVMYFRYRKGGKP